MFRDEVRQARRYKLYGDVSLALPISWQVIGYGLLAMLLTAAVFLYFASYSRVEVVPGRIEPDLGSAAVLPSRAGVIIKLLAKEGDRVRAGAPLAIIRAEEIDQGGGPGAARTLGALEQQEKQLLLRESAVLGGARATRARFAAQAAGLAGEISAIDSQIATQRDLIAIAETDFKRARAISERGFVSRRDLQTREETLLSRQQQLANLIQLRTEKSGSLAEAKEGAVEAENVAASTAAQVVGDRASVAERKFDIEANRGYSLVAPVGGAVTAVTGRLGQAVRPDTPVMTIVPAGARLEAQLYVPTRAAGFITVGDEVRLKIDAYSYERFGTISGRISNFSSATINYSDGEGKEEPAYLVTVAVPRPTIYAFGQMRKLRPGMTLTANIITRRQTLFERLFEPLFAVRR
ncbi:HlyD family secretion protein [Sphingomonas sp. 3-13AW]|uniref:HlyD family secretion protein n=1 Tax=Sphingomonas sp. 3-13AW TaxID=3050450 RepID=UPI003BB60F41